MDKGLIFAPSFPVNSKAFSVDIDEAYVISYYKFSIPENGDVTFSLDSTSYQDGYSATGFSSYIADSSGIPIFDYSQGFDNLVNSHFLDAGDYFAAFYSTGTVGKLDVSLSFATSLNPTPVISQISAPVSAPAITANTNQILTSNINAYMVSGDLDLTFSGDSRDNIIFGNEGYNVIKGGAGNDSIDSGYGSDTIDGGDGNDIIDTNGSYSSIKGGLGDDSIRTGFDSDTIDGGAGNDTINASSGRNDIKGGSGNDTISSYSGDDKVDGGDGNDTIDAGQGRNDIKGGSGNDFIFVGDRADKVDGGDGNDTIDAGDGLNTVSGGKGDDVIYAGSYNDKVDGGAGIDRLMAGLGNDSLTGGADADSFVLSLLGGIDTITDFKTGVDKLVFSDSLTPTSLDAFHFVSSPNSVFSFSTTSDSYGYNSKTGALFHDVDGSGDVAQVQIALIANKAALVASDILI